MLEEHKFPLESFIGGWYINPNICSALIDLFHKNPKHHKQGVIGGPYNVNIENKDSIDLANSIASLMQKNYNSLKSIGIEGRKNVLKKFDVDKMCQTTFTEYKKLIELS